MKIKLSTLTALVTGGAGGIGSAICRALAAEGAAVAIHYRTSADDARSLACELQALGGRATVVAGDITQEHEAARVVAETVAALGGLDILVNNAGWTQVVAPDDLAGLTDELIAHTFALKVNGPIHLIRAAEPHLRTSANGNVVNITSAAGVAARGSSHAYAAANAALSTLTRSFARVLAPQVRVNSVAPGFVDTGFGFPAEGVAAAHVARNNHLGRCATPADVAAAVRFLCADTSVVTGEEIVVDAGIGRLGKK
jgi:3-oxoacyl-[acyl-carrier protein] reductase